MQHEIVLYNPSEVFYTMLLVLLAFSSVSGCMKCWRK